MYQGQTCLFIIEENGVTFPYNDPDPLTNSFNQLSLIPPTLVTQEKVTFIIDDVASNNTMYEVPGYPGIYIPFNRVGNRKWRAPTCDCKSRGLAKHQGHGIYICVHNCLKTNFPRQAREWDYEKNHPLRPEDVLPACGLRVWWKCENNTCGHHMWEARITGRTRKHAEHFGCPFCSNNRTCPCKSVVLQCPRLVAEYHPTLNTLPLASYSKGSTVKIWWKCLDHQTCNKHVWLAPICERRSGSIGCPFCANWRTCDCNHLGITHPHLAAQWHPANKVAFWQVTHGSRYVAWWVCSNHKSCNKHVWECKVSQLTNPNANNGCPMCSGQRVCDCNNLLALKPDVAAFWHPTKNDFGPETVTPNSAKRAWFRCKEGHESYVIVQSRSRGRYCYICSEKGYSRVAIRWIQRIQQAQGITIRHALSEGGEFQTEVGNVDGYCKETNTVYEYHGVYWHGHPSLGRDNEIHAGWKDGRTFADVYRRTMIRDEQIRSLGYNLVIMWEHEDDGTNI